MRLAVHAPSLLSSPALVDHAENRFTTVLRRFAARVDHVTLRLSDENGPRGVDKRCRAEVVLSGAETLIIEERGVDLYAAIGSVAKRIKQTLARQVHRQRFA